jgi:uroporphyrinogen-III synthase
VNPLAGITVALTSDRRAHELITAFRRRGAEVLHAPTLRIVPFGEDSRVVAATEELIAHPPDVVIATTAIGFRGWIEAAEAAGLADELFAALGGAQLLARGPKAKGAIRAAGLTESWSAESETTQEVIRLLVGQGVAGRRVAVQLHGATAPGQLEQLEQLARAGADVVPVPVYRWGPAPDPAAVQRIVDATCRRLVDAVVFTSAPGTQAFLDAAQAEGRLRETVEAMRTDVLAAAVGPITAEPLTDQGVKPLVPERGRLGALVRAVTDRLDGTGVREVRTAGGTLRLCGNEVDLDGRALTLSPVPLALLRALARRPGAVLDRGALLPVMPGAGDLHAVEVAVARLRRSLGSPAVIETVIKRGYRLSVAADPG